jgi:hypothetical protein
MMPFSVNTADLKDITLPDSTPRRGMRSGLTLIRP